eukprot:357204-Chlamydomonas_euryale.AAC.6
MGLDTAWGCPRCAHAGNSCVTAPSQDYFDKVKEPMDLGTILAVLNKGMYQHYTQVIHHLMVRAACSCLDEDAAQQNGIVWHAAWASTGMAYCMGMGMVWHGIPHGQGTAWHAAWAWHDILHGPCGT